MHKTYQTLGDLAEQEIWPTLPEECSLADAQEVARYMRDIGYIVWCSVGLTITASETEYWDVLWNNTIEQIKAANKK